jgi:DNA segregation ATPase FtsK/SpoIIIE, S-DNA-T family
MSFSTKYARTVSKFPTVDQTLGLLSTLRGAVREFTSREKALRQSCQSRRTAETKAAEFTLNERSAQLADRISAARKSTDSARHQIEERFGARNARINRAFQQSRKRALEKISHVEGRQKYNLQKRSLDAARQSEADIASATARLDDFHSRHAELEERFERLERLARDTFGCAAEFRALLEPDHPWPEAAVAPDEYQLLEQLGQLHDLTASALRRFRQNVLLALFRAFPLWTLIALSVLGYASVVFAFPNAGISAQHAAAGLATLVAIFTGAFFLGKTMGRPAAVSIAGNLDKARQLRQASLETAELRHKRDTESIKSAQLNLINEMDLLWQQAIEEAERARVIEPRNFEEKMNRVCAKHSSLLRRRIEKLENQCAETVALLQQEEAVRRAELTSALEARLTAVEQEFHTDWQELDREWKACVQPIAGQIASWQAAATEIFPPWADPLWLEWTPRLASEQAVKFGHLEVDIEQMAEVKFADYSLSFPAASRFSVPLLLAYPEQASLLLETAGEDRDEAAGLFNSIVLRLLALAHPGRISLTIIDPVGLGKDFASLMHLADYEEGPLKGRIWTQPAQIEEKLGALAEHIEKVIQMYLRNEFRSIAEYNAQAGAITEQYHFVIIAGFPVNFSETAGRRLLNIAASGARCGVHTLIHWDQRHPLPHEFVSEELRSNSIRICRIENALALVPGGSRGIRLCLDSPPPARLATELLRKIGQSTKGLNRFELPFQEITPPGTNRWTEDTSEELRVPVGRTGASKLQYLVLGKGTRQHALIVGKTGSGKSTFFHVVITNLSLWCSPEQVEFYLVDFKKGVEFKCYAIRRLPHARVVAIESDREYGLSVLQRVDEELRRRGDLFRKAGVQDFAGYRASRPGQPLPRSLLVLDEFQEFFTEEDRVSQGASVLLDRIVRQGRAFGIHVLLGSQTLGGAYTLARSTIGQMVVRIALQCNESDTCLVMDETNAAPRLLSRPGEGIYNDAAGAVEGNSPFQTAWLPDDARDRYLTEVRQLADASSTSNVGPVIFEGNAPAEISENSDLLIALKSTPARLPLAPAIWIGSPNSIKGPTSVLFKRQRGDNLLVVGQNQEAALAIIAAALISLGAQCPKDAARWFLLESTAPESAERRFLDRVISALPQNVIRPERNELPRLLNDLASSVLEHEHGAPQREVPATFLLISSLHDFKQLKQEDEFSFAGEADNASPAASFKTLIAEGPPNGIHIIASIDTYNNVSRFIGRKLLSEFQARVLFQMSPTDSASLIDTPDASRLGLHRAILYSEREGSIEKFRPYAPPSAEWLEAIGTALQ